MGKKRHVSLSSKAGLRVKDDGIHTIKPPPPPLSLFIVYWPGPPRGNPTIVKVTTDKKRAEEAAERFALENGGLRCQLVVFHNVECMGEYPKKEKTNG